MNMNNGLEESRTHAQDAAEAWFHESSIEPTLQLKERLVNMLMRFAQRGYDFAKQPPARPIRVTVKDGVKTTVIPGHALDMVMREPVDDAESHDDGCTEQGVILR